MLMCPVTGLRFESKTWPLLLKGEGVGVPGPDDDAVEEVGLCAAAVLPFVPVHDTMPAAVHGRLVPLYTRVKVQLAARPSGVWRAYFGPVKTAGQPGGWLVRCETGWRFYVDSPEEA